MVKYTSPREQIYTESFPGDYNVIRTSSRISSCIGASQIYVYAYIWQFPIISTNSVLTMGKIQQTVLE